MHGFAGRKSAGLFETGADGERFVSGGRGTLNYDYHSRNSTGDRTGTAGAGGGAGHFDDGVCGGDRRAGGASGDGTGIDRRLRAGPRLGRRS